MGETPISNLTTTSYVNASEDNWREGESPSQPKLRTRLSFYKLE